ncbi:MAG: type IV pilus modification protein PilV [Cellvibrionaceae bacterium]|nr:type IV pilus modification protein PilV [Cellvibrionaceae bacterium]
MLSKTYAFNCCGREVHTNAATQSVSGAKQEGTTLIEVMVAALIMGIGILGILSLQGRALQFSQQSYLFSQATILAQDMAERMSSNRQALDAYRNNPATASTDCTQNTCSSAQLAAWDRFHWEEAVKNNLPAGRGVVALAPGGGAYVISVEFVAERDSSGSSSLETVKLLVAAAND